ncbi:MAG: hypothetical protein OHK0046_24550 [Anaerolineae bacterium]
MRTLFIGAWRLVRYAYQTETGEVRSPFGENPKGLIMYDASGMVSVQILSAERPLFATEDMFAASDKDIRLAYLGLNTYYGTFTVDESQHIVTHHLEGSSVLNREGTDLVRTYEFTQEDGVQYLTLKAVPRLMNGEMLTGVLVWSRV